MRKKRKIKSKTYIVEFEVTEYDEIEIQARNIEEAKKKGLGATSIGGKMVDEATYKIAKETLTFSEKIAKRRKS